MVLTAALLQITTTSPQATVAMTLSAASLFAVGGVIFKAGKWLGEHEALKKEVTSGHLQLSQEMRDKFAEVRQDIRDLRGGV